VALKNSRHLRQEIRLRKQVDDAQRQVGDDVEGWGRYAAQHNRRKLAQAERDLAETIGGFEWEFDGLGVYGTRIALGRLTELARPLGQAMRQTARDLLFHEGPVETDADLRDLVEPVVAGTFGGSFGLRLAAPPVTEHLTLLEAPLFERTATRIINIFQAAAESEEAVFQELAGLRQLTLSGLQALAEKLAEAGRPAVIRWQGETVVTVQPEFSETLVRAISASNPREEEAVVEATLAGADLDLGNFHLLVSEAENVRHVRGKAEPGLSLRGIRLGSRVTATLLIVRLDSPVLEEPKESYFLRSITPSEKGP
jgi:hypothetical protein